jgi:hypothetical protein
MYFQFYSQKTCDKKAELCTNGLHNHEKTKVINSTHRDGIFAFQKVTSSVVSDTALDL